MGSETPPAPYSSYSRAFRQINAFYNAAHLVLEFETLHVVHVSVTVVKVSLQGRPRDVLSCACFHCTVFIKPVTVIPEKSTTNINNISNKISYHQTGYSYTQQISTMPYKDINNISSNRLQLYPANINNCHIIRISIIYHQKNVNNISSTINKWYENNQLKISTIYPQHCYLVNEYIIYLQWCQ